MPKFGTLCSHGRILLYVWLFEDKLHWQTLWRGVSAGATAKIWSSNFGWSPCQYIRCGVGSGRNNPGIPYYDRLDVRIDIFGHRRVNWRRLHHLFQAKEGWRWWWRRCRWSGCRAIILRRKSGGSCWYWQLRQPWQSSWSCWWRWYGQSSQPLPNGIYGTILENNLTIVFVYACGVAINSKCIVKFVEAINIKSLRSVQRIVGRCGCCWYVNNRMVVVSMIICSILYVSLVDGEKMKIE